MSAKAECCGAECLFDFGGPCWGDVEVVEEEYADDDHWWIHACQGHRAGWDGCDDPARYVAESTPRPTA